MGHFFQGSAGGSGEAGPHGIQTPRGPDSKASSSGRGADGEPEPLPDREILKELGSYLLVRNSPELRWRVAASLGLLLGAKGLNVAVRGPCCRQFSYCFLLFLI
jgi:hypothetical protein